MNEALRVWMEQAAAIPGVLALAFRAADQSVMARSFHDDFPVRNVEKLTLELLDTVRSLQLNRVPSERLRWSFEKAWLYYAARPDGSFAVVLVNKKEEVAPEVDYFLAQFQAS